MGYLRRYTMALTAIILLVSVLSSTALFAAGGENTPKFFVREKTIDLGNYYEGVDVEYEFKVRNNGIGELHILNVRPG